MTYNRIPNGEPISDARLNEIISEPCQTVSDRFDSNDLNSYFQDHVWVSSESKALEKKLVTPSWKFMCPKRMRVLFDRALKANWCSPEQKAMIEAALKQI